MNPLNSCHQVFDIHLPFPYSNCIQTLRNAAFNQESKYFQKDFSLIMPTQTFQRLDEFFSYCQLALKNFSSISSRSWISSGWDFSYCQLVLKNFSCISSRFWISSGWDALKGLATSLKSEEASLSNWVTPSETTAGTTSNVVNSRATFCQLSTWPEKIFGWVSSNLLKISRDGLSPTQGFNHHIPIHDQVRHGRLLAIDEELYNLLQSIAPDQIQIV